MLELKEAIGLDGEIATIAAKNPQLVVFTVERPMPYEQRECLSRYWRDVTAGTALEGVKAIVLHGGVKLSIVDDVGDADA